MTASECKLGIYYIKDEDENVYIFKVLCNFSEINYGRLYIEVLESHHWSLPKGYKNEYYYNHFDSAFKIITESEYNKILKNDEIERFKLSLRYKQ